MPLDPSFEEVIKRPSDLRKVGDETSVEVGESLECTIFCGVGGNLPFFNTRDLDWVHHDRAIFKNHAKELNPSCLKNALAGFQV